MAKSAGVLLFRRSGERIEVLLAHHGGPFWTNRDEGAWSIPKGAIGEGEEPLAAAKREFREEIGFAPEGEAVKLAPVKQPGGKLVHAWAMRGDFDVAGLRSNTFTIEWPPRSGRIMSFPEVDRAAWFPLPEARKRMLKGQTPFLTQLEELLKEP